MSVLVTDGNNSLESGTLTGTGLFLDWFDLQNFVLDKVRKIIDKDLFEKGYTANWSDEIYKIKEIRQSNGVCWYYLVSLDEKPVDGIWYYYQLNLVSSHADQSVRLSEKQ